MHAVVLTIHLLLALALILVVLLQRSEGGGLGMGGGGGVMTSRSAATALSKVTWVIGTSFVVTSLVLTILGGARQPLGLGHRRRRRGLRSGDGAGDTRTRGRPAAATSRPTRARGGRTGRATAGSVGLHVRAGNLWLLACDKPQDVARMHLARAAIFPYRLSPVGLGFQQNITDQAREQ